MTSAAELLPRNATALERGLSVAMTDGLPVPFASVLDPMTAPVEFLPFLAAHRSVDLWFSDWPEERKRRMVAEAITLAALKGSRAAAEAFLSFVDTVIVHKRSYPSHAPVGRIAAGVTPVQSKPHKATFLLKTPLKPPVGAFVARRSAIGRAAIRAFDFSPLRRAEQALTVSKSPETAYTVTHAHRIPIALDEGLDLAAGHVFGSFKDRFRL